MISPKLDPAMPLPSPTKLTLMVTEEMQSAHLFAENLCDHTPNKAGESIVILPWLTDTLRYIAWR